MAGRNGRGGAGRRVRAAAWDDAVGTTFKSPDAFGHRRPRQPIGTRRGATLPLTGGPDADSGGWQVGPTRQRFPN
jgi:hypothetical protein